MIVIVIPTYNENDNIAGLIKAIFDLKNPLIHIIIIDDNSPDGTAQTVAELTKKYPITLLSRSQKSGIGSAYILGFQKAIELGAEYIFQMDADFSHDPKDIPRFIKAIDDADLIIGSRKIRGGKIIGWGMWRHLMSNTAMFIARNVLRLKTRDVTAGFRCFQAHVLKNIDLSKIKSNGYAFQEELLYRTEQKNYRIKEIPVMFHDRKEGKSKLSKKDIGEFFIVMIKLFFEKNKIR